MMRRCAWIGLIVVVATSACGDDKNLELTEAPASESSGSPPGDTGSPPGTGTSSADTTGMPTTTMADSTSFPVVTGDETAGLSTTDPFIMPMDGGTGTIECDPFAQNCPPGEKCSAYAAGGGSSWDANKCVPVMEDPRQPGEPCVVQDSGVSGIDDCALGSMCWGVGDDLTGTCVELCTGTAMDPMCHDVGTLCVVVNDGVLNLCLERCDPLMVDCAGDLCIAQPADEGFVCVLDASGDGGQVHTPCSFANSCDVGLVCGPPASASECDQGESGCCLAFCDLTLPDPDSQCVGAGQQCLPYFTMMPPAGDEDVGVCRLPP